MYEIEINLHEEWFLIWYLIMQTRNKLFHQLAIISNAFWIVLYSSSLIIYLFRMSPEKLSIFQYLILSSTFVSLNAILWGIVVLIWSIFRKTIIHKYYTLMFVVGTLAWILINVKDPGNIYNHLMIQ
jgi:hypothetical protein